MMTAAEKREVRERVAWWIAQTWLDSREARRPEYARTAIRRVIAEREQPNPSPVIALRPTQE